MGVLYAKLDDGTWEVVFPPDVADVIGVPPGGTTGQVLAKNSATNYDIGWVNPSSGGEGGITQAEADALYVNLTGDTMSGALNIPGPPTLDTQAARKKYVDDRDAVTLFSANTFTNDSAVSIGGDTMTGALHCPSGISVGGTHLWEDGSVTIPNGLNVTGASSVNGTFQSNALTCTQLTTTSAGIVCAGSIIAASGYSQNGGDPASGAGIQTTAAGKISSAVAAGGGDMVQLRRGGAPSVGEKFIQFLSGGAPGTQCGYISKQAGATINYIDGTSDYRLKDELGPVEGALERLLDLRPIRFTWKSEPEAGEFEGFIAHELAEVVPTAVAGEKDAVDKEGNIEPQGVDLSKTLPLLIAAVQELAHRVEELSQ